MNKKAWEKGLPYILLTPAMLLICVVIVYPILKTIYISFFNYVLWNPAGYKFIGLGNYIKAFKDGTFQISLINTLKLVAIVLPVEIILSMYIASLLNRDFRGNRVVRSLMLIPWATPVILSALMWMWICHGNLGLLNEVLKDLGLLKVSVPWLAQTQTAFYTVMVVLIWKELPYLIIMFLSGMANIPAEQYEAGIVDGVNKFQKLIYITLPNLKNLLFVVITLEVIWISNNINYIFIMTNGGPANSSLTLTVYAYTIAETRFDFGYASTLSIILTAITLVFMMFYFKAVNILEEK